MYINEDVSLLKCVNESDELVRFVYSNGKEIFFNRFTLKWVNLMQVTEEEIKHVRESRPVITSNYMYYRLEQSTKCNLNCKYCCVKRNNIYEKLNENNMIMSIDTARTLLDQYAKEAETLNQEKKLVYFYGEEPFAGWDTLKEILSDKRFEFMVNTNGTLLDEERLRYLAEPHVYTIFSLDGITYQHNRLRFDNADQFKLVIKNYERLRELGGRGGFNITVHRDNEKELYDIIRTFTLRYKPDGIGLGIPMYYSTGEVEAADIDIPALINTFKKLFDFSKAEGIFLPYISSKMRPLITGVFRKYWCDAISNNRTFLPSGKEIICSRLASKGNISKEMLESWIPLNNPYCSKCEAIGICGGGCPWSANMWYKNHVDERECEINKQMLPFILNRLSEVANSSDDDKLPQIFKNMLNAR